MAQRAQKPKSKRLNKENIMVSMIEPQIMMARPELPIDKKIGLYGRQSSLYQVLNNVDSYDYQVDEQKRFIQHYGWKEHLIIEYFQDFTVSGTLGIGERVGITQLVEDIESGIIKAVYTQLEDRLFRDRHLENVIKFAKACDEHHIVVLTSYRIYYMWIDYDREAFIEACKQAWKAFDTQINKRMLPMRAYASHSGKYDARPINIGYTVDKDKNSPTYKRYIPDVETQNASMITWLFNRCVYYAGDTRNLRKELELMPGYHFAKYTDPKVHNKCHLKKVPGGYRIGDGRSIERILRNNVYIGVWKTGNKEYEHKHQALVDIETWDTVQYLLDKRKEAQRPQQRHNSETVLKGLVLRPAKGYAVVIKPYTDEIRFEYKANPDTDMRANRARCLPFKVVEDLFKEKFTAHIKQDEKCQEYSQSIDAIHTREEKNREHLQDTLDNLRKRHASLYEDATTLSIPKLAKQQMYTDMADIEVEIVRLENKLKEPTKAVPLKDLAELIDGIRKNWDSLPFEKLKGLTQLFTRGIVLKQLSCHFWSYEIHWEVWGVDKGLIWVWNAGHQYWTDEHLEILKQLHEKGLKVATKEEFLHALPNYSPSAIIGRFKTEYGYDPFPQQNHLIEHRLSSHDREIVKNYNLELEVLKKHKNLAIPTAYLTLEQSESANEDVRRSEEINCSIAPI